MTHLFIDANDDMPASRSKALRAALICGMANGIQDARMSVLYSYVRSRQLEGTIPWIS